MVVQLALLVNSYPVVPALNFFPILLEVWALSVQALVYPGPLSHKWVVEGNWTKNILCEENMFDVQELLCYIPIGDHKNCRNANSGHSSLVSESLQVDVEKLSEHLVFTGE